MIPGFSPVFTVSSIVSLSILEQLNNLMPKCGWGAENSDENGDKFFVNISNQIASSQFHASLLKLLANDKTNRIKVEYQVNRKCGSRFSSIKLSGVNQDSLQALAIYKSIFAKLENPELTVAKSSRSLIL